MIKIYKFKKIKRSHVFPSKVTLLPKIELRYVNEAEKHFSQSSSEDPHFHMYVKKSQISQYNVTGQDSAEVPPSSGCTRIRSS